MSQLKLIQGLVRKALAELPGPPEMDGKALSPEKIDFFLADPSPLVRCLQEENPQFRRVSPKILGKHVTSTLAVIKAEIGPSSKEEIVSVEDGNGTAEGDSSKRKNVEKKRKLNSSGEGAKKGSGSEKTGSGFEPSSIPKVKLSSVGGCEQIREKIAKWILRPFTSRALYDEIGARPPSAILLHGPTGSGKTMLASAIANEVASKTEINFFNVPATEVVAGVSGASEAKLRTLFETAKSGPSIILLDQIDAICPKSDGAMKDMSSRIVSQLGLCMDEAAGSGLLILATTARPESIDSSLRRPGRFDHELAIGMPSRAAREEILHTLINTFRVKTRDVDVSELARLTPGFVGADLAALVRQAALETGDRLVLMGEGQKEVVDLEEGDEMSDKEKVPEELRAVRMEDFLLALRDIQPAAKREGFSTVPGVTWEEVGSLSSLKAELEQTICLPIQKPEIFERFKLKPAAGVLLFGPPGCGKTLIAKAAANASQANFISVKGPELLSKYVGDSEKAVRQVFSRAATSAPCVVFFDELDALCPSRNSDSGNQASDRVVNQLLAEMDGMDSRREVFVIGASNRPEMIDPAMRRPGRLGKLLYVPIPDCPGREDILSRHLKGKPADLTPEEVRRVAEQTGRFSGADLAQLCETAVHAALQRSLHADGKETSLTLEDFEVAMKKVTPSVSEKDQREYDQMASRLHTTVLS